MPLSSIIILSYIVGMFAVFTVPLAGVSAWIAVSELRERTARRRRTGRAAPLGGLSRVHRVY